MSRANTPRELVIDHGVAAVFDDEGLAGVALHVGQRLGQRTRRAQPVLGVGEVADIGHHGRALVSLKAVGVKALGRATRPAAASAARSSAMPAPLQALVARISGWAAGWRVELGRQPCASSLQRARRRQPCRPWSARSGRRPRPGRARSWRAVAVLQPVAGVDQQAEAHAGWAGPQIELDQARPGPDLLPADAGEAVARQVDQQQPAAEIEEVDLLGAPRRVERRGPARCGR